MLTRTSIRLWMIWLLLISTVHTTYGTMNAQALTQQPLHSWVFQKESNTAFQTTLFEYTEIVSNPKENNWSEFQWSTLIQYHNKVFKVYHSTAKQRYLSIFEVCTKLYLKAFTYSDKDESIIG